MSRTGLLALVVLAACAAAAPAQERLTIYSSLPLSGPARADALDVQRGMRLALEESGAAVRYVSLNDAGSRGWQPELVVRNARRAVSDDTTIAYLGEFNSGATAVSMPYTNEAGILQITPSATYVGLTRTEGAERGEPDKYYPSGLRFFGRVIPADHRQADALVAYLRALGARSVYLADDGEAYGDGLADMVARRARAAGLTVAGRGRHSARRPGHAAIAQRVRSTGADALVFGGIALNRAATLFNAVRRRNPAVHLLGGEGLFDSAFTRALTRGARARTHVTSAPLARAAYPAPAQAFAQRFRAKHGRDPRPFAIYGYEAMAAALASVAAAGEQPDTAARRDATARAFFAIRDRDSLLGRYSIDANGDTTLATFMGYGVTRAGSLRFDRALALP